MNALRKREVQNIIDTTWENPQGKELRDRLFPDGKPEPEEFIKTVAQYAKNKRV